MISKVEIRNFSTHKKQDIEFDPNVTTITGSSFLGKSTILRAIKFVCTNQPTGDKFISWDTDKTSVRLTIDEKKIVRRKGKGVNSYNLSTYKEPFKAFGNNVPKPISDLVNMGDLNFQGQHDKPFWFCETAGEVSRQLNAIINLEVIDRTLSNIASGIRKANTTIEIIQERLDNAVEDKKELEYAIELDKDLIEIEELEAEKSRIAVESTTLRDITANVVRHRSQRDNAAQSMSDGVAALEKGSIWLKIRDLVEDLDNRVKTGVRADRIIQSAPASMIVLNKLKSKWIEHREKRESLESLIDDIENEKNGLCKKTQEIVTLQNDLMKVSKGVCPLCQRPLKK